MSKDLTFPCPCGKPKPFSRCCGVFLLTDALAKTPEQLMRSRYSAYALGDYGAYLFKTWFPATVGELQKAELSQKELDWCGLEVLAKSQQGNHATVEFKAWYLSNEEGAELYRGKLCSSLHEKSAFTRAKGIWFYVGGEIF